MVFVGPKNLLFSLEDGNPKKKQILRCAQNDDILREGEGQNQPRVEAAISGASAEGTGCGSSGQLGDKSASFRWMMSWEYLDM